MRRRTFLRGVGALSAFVAVPTVAAGGGTATGGGTPTQYASPASVSLTGVIDAVVGDDGTTAYVAASDGFGVVDVSEVGNPTVLAERRNLLADRENGPLTNIYDVKVSGDRLLVAGPNHSVGSNTLGGFLLYDVSDPAEPERLAFFETDHGIHNAYLDGDTAYLTGTGAAGEPLVVVDVSDDEPREIARWSVTDENGDWFNVEDSIHQCHDVYVQNDTAYVAYWDAGTWLLDVRDPANPTVELRVGGRDPGAIPRSDTDPFTEIRELPGNSHYVAPNEDGTLLAVGREAWDDEETDRTGGPGGITLWDVSDRSSPERLTRLAPPRFEETEEVNRTSHNFGFRGDRLYTSWYNGGVRVFDVATPAEPMLIGSWEEPSETSFWTAQPIDGGFVATSIFDPTKYEELSREEKREPNESAEVFTFPEPSGEDARPARTGQVTETEGSAARSTEATTSTTEATETTETTEASMPRDEGTSTDSTDAGTDSTRTETTTGSSSAADTPGFGVAASVVGGGLALARLLQKNRE